MFKRQKSPKAGEIMVGSGAWRGAGQENKSITVYSSRHGTRAGQ